MQPRTKRLLTAEDRVDLQKALRRKRESEKRNQTGGGALTAVTEVSQFDLLASRRLSTYTAHEAEDTKGREGRLGKNGAGVGWGGKIETDDRRKRNRYSR